MLLKAKGQSTAEYAILIALVAAVAAGFLSVSLKGGIRNKNQQASNFLMTAGDATLLGNPASTGNALPLYSQEVSKSTLKGDSFKSTSVLEQGGSEKKLQSQTTESESINLETLDSGN